GPAPPGPARGPAPPGPARGPAPRVDVTTGKVAPCDGSGWRSPVIAVAVLRMSGRADRPLRRLARAVGDGEDARFTAGCKTEEVRTPEQRLTESGESIAAASRRS
ncbi:hypothetical protein, partial [Nonomuraea antimicrobica]|uniref:hypothetical protein n=1 Tax=Nonomuraea antimicrobica TaxID=561173 RepID=UPI0031ED6DA5